MQFLIVDCFCDRFVGEIKVSGEKYRAVIMRNYKHV